MKIRGQWIRGVYSKEERERKEMVVDEESVSGGENDRRC